MSSSSDQLWQSFLLARMLRQNDVAFENFNAYLELWARLGKNSVTPSPMISSLCDRYGLLKPSIAFDLSGDVWLLSEQPKGLLSLFQTHLDLLTEKLLSDTLFHQRQSEINVVLERVLGASTILVRVAGSQENYSHINECSEKLVESVLKVIHALLGLFKYSPGSENVQTIIASLCHSVAFLHSIVDPRRAWQKNFMHLHHVIKFSRGQIIPVPSSVSELFITIFNNRWGEIEKAKESWIEFQLHVLHLIGALCSSCKVNCEHASSENVCLLLLTLLDPREQCTSIQVLATRLMIKVIHVFHTSVAETQTTVDTAMLLVTFLNMLVSRYYEGKLISPCIRMVATILDAIPDLLNPEDLSTADSESLKILFVEVGCYEKVCEVLTLVQDEAQENPADCRELVCGIFRAFSAVTKSCQVTRQDFEQRVGHSALFELITKTITLTESVLQEALNMVVEEKYKFRGKNHTIFNTSAIKMLFRWLSSMPNPLQLWLAQRLYDMCEHGSLNKQRCCIAGVFKTVLEVLTDSQQPDKAFIEDVEDLLIDTIEALGMHSIQTSELKQLIGAVRPLENGKLPTYYYRLQKAMTLMADSGSEGVSPLHYFDLRMEDSYISIPELKRFPASSSLSFHMWVSLDSTHFYNQSRTISDLALLSSSATSTSSFPPRHRRKRMLYSFYTNSGTGFEAFFTSNNIKTCTLVVATVTKKEFISLALNEFQLDTQHWYSIAIVYSVPKRPWGKSEVQVYIDGEQKKVAVMKTPSFSENFTSCLIGFAPSRASSALMTRETTPPDSTAHSVIPDSSSSSSSSSSSCDTLGRALLTVPMETASRHWGEVANLQGLISSFCIFSEALNPSHFTTIHKKGPNDLSIYQYKCTDTYELGYKLFLYFHAKSVKKGTCINLSPLYVGKSENLYGKFTGQNYITWDIKAVLGSLGGVELLFPILEQVSLPVTERKFTEEEDNGDRSKSPSSRWFGESEGVAAFLKLLVAMLSNNQSNQNRFFHSEGPATVAALLMKVPAPLITVSAFHAIQELVELFNRLEHTRVDVYKHLIFEFRVWSRPSYSVRIGHIQYISNVVRNMKEWRQVYGVQYILDVIRVFYSSVDSTPSNDVVGLDMEEVLSIRAALLMIIKYYLMNSAGQDEVDGLMAFIPVCTDGALQEELLSMLRNLLTKSDCGRELGQMIWERGSFLLFLIRAPSMPVRLISIKILSHLLSQHKDVEGALPMAFKDGSVAAAIGHMTEPNMSSAIVIALTELCVAKDVHSYTDYISSMDIFMSMIQLLREAPLTVRNTLCQLVNSILHHTPEDITRILFIPGWEVMFFWLLTPFQLNGDHTSPSSHSSPPSRVLLPSNDVTASSLQLDHPHPPTETSPHPPTETSPHPSTETSPHLPTETSPYPPTETSSRPSTETSPHPPTETSPHPPTETSPHPLTKTSPLPTETSPHPPTETSSHPPNNLLPTSIRRPDLSPDSPYAVKNFTLDLQYRSRSKAIVQELKMRKRSLCVSTPWTDTVEPNFDNEVSRTVDIVTQTFRRILWHSAMDQIPGKVWGKFFSSLDQFEAQNSLIVPSYIIKQKLLTFFCHDVIVELKEGIDRSATLEKMLDLSKQLEIFVISTYPDITTAEEQEVLLLKLAHNFFPEVNIKHYSLGLQEEYLKMLMSAGIFDQKRKVAFVLNEIEISQSAARILLGCLASGNKEYYVAASLKLKHMLECPCLAMKDVYFIFSNLARIAQIAIEDDDSDWLQYVASILRCLFSSNNFPHLELDKELPSVPDHRTPSFGMEFGRYCMTKEWKEYTEGTLKTAEVQQYSDVLLNWLREKMKRSEDCKKEADEDNEKRKDTSVANEMRYQQTLVQINELLVEEVKRQESSDSQLRNELSVTLQKWRSTRRFFTGERGAWSSRRTEQYLWKLDRTENFSRMRMRLARNYNFDTHEDASRLRDTGLSSDSFPSKEKSNTQLLAKVTKRQSSSLEEEDVLLEQLWSDANSPALREDGQEDPSSTDLKEKLVKGVQCYLIMLMEKIPGRLEITSKHLFFLSDQSEKNQTQTWYSTDFKIPLSQMREIHSRRYNMSRTAFEIFLVDQTNYFINFPNKKVMNSVYSTIIHLRPQNLNRVGIRKPAKLLKESGLTQKWVKREITNFDYLMQLNTISGRTYNDLNQYPVFPWILKDYESEELCLDDEQVYRDLSKPVGAQNPVVEENVRSRYEEFDDPTLGKFHFGSHYSNAAGIMHYLIRLEPFTSLHIELQSGRFDFADRQFFSIPSTWSNIYKSGTDQKELIPEFFYQPEFLKNINRLDLGKLQTGMVLNDVILPKWASSAEDFIIKHREALESEYVSSHLHDWIDLIFGYKQTGPEAEKACNIFNFYTYEENVNLESLKDDKEKRQIESIINNFGQTPTQLFLEPHPHRLPIESARKTQTKGFTATFMGKRLLVNLFDKMNLLKAHSVDVSQDPIVFVGTPSIQTKALLISGNPEQLVTVNKHGLLNLHGWLPFSNSKNRPFTFQFDPNAHFDRSRWQYVGGPFAQDIAIKSNLFVLSPNNKYLVSGGHWDNSFRVYLVEKGKLSARITHHNDVVTCMSLDKAGLGDHLITGSRDTSCAIWKFGVNGIQSHPLQTLYGHDSEVLCASISTELDLAISGAKDGTCLLHTVRQGLYIHTLRPRKRLKCEIHQVAISSTGRLVLYTEDTTHRQRLIASVPPCLHLYTVNGQLLLEKELAECINAMSVIDKYLITGNTRGYLTFRNLFTLQQLHSLNLSEAIQCISVVLDHHSKVPTHILVGLDSGKLIIVSVKDALPETKPQ